MFKDIKAKVIKPFATEQSVSIPVNGEALAPIVISDSVIIKTVEKIFDDLEKTKKDASGHSRYNPGAFDEVKKQLLDTNSDFFLKVRDFVQQMFAVNKNPFGVKEKLVAIVKNFVNSISLLSTLGTKSVDILRLKPEEYVEEQRPDFNTLLQNELDKVPTETLESIFTKLLSDFYNTHMSTWDTPTGLKDTIKRILDKRIGEIAKFKPDASEVEYPYIQRLISWLEDKLPSIWTTSQADFVKEIKDELDKDGLKGDKIMIISDLLKRDVEKQAEHYFQSQVLLKKVKDLITESNMENLEKVFPGIKKILNNHGLTEENLVFPEFRQVDREGASWLVAEGPLTYKSSNTTFPVLEFKNVEIDKHETLWDAGTKLLNTKISQMRWDKEDPTNEFLLSKLFDFAQDEFSEFSSPEGFSSTLDKLRNVLSDPTVDLSFSKLNGNHKYTTHLKISNDIKIWAEDGKITFHITLSELKDSDNSVVQSKVFEIVFPIKIESIMSSLQRKLAAIQQNFALDGKFYKEQFYKKDGKTLLPLTSWGKKYLLDHSNIENSIRVLSDYIKDVNTYEPGYSLTPEIIFSKTNDESISVTITLANSEETHSEDFQLLSLRTLPSVSKDMANDGPNNYYNVVIEYLSSITPRAPKDQLLPALGATLPLTYKIKQNFLNQFTETVKGKKVTKDYTLQQLHDLIAGMGYTYTQTKLKKLIQDTINVPGQIERKGIEINYEINIPSLQEDKELEFNYAYQLPLDFKPTTEKQIKDTLEYLIKQLPEKIRNVKAARDQIIAKFREGIWDEKTQQYKDDIGQDDLDRKIVLIAPIAKDIKHYTDIRSKIEELYGGKIPPKVEKLIADPENLGTLTDIANLIGKVDPSILKSILENKEFIKRLNSLNPNAVKNIIKALDKGKEYSKYTYFGIGAGLGLSSLAIGGSSLYLARTRSKIKKTNTKIKTKRTMVILSALFALLSAGASVVMMLLFFLEKGGF